VEAGQSQLPLLVWVSEWHPGLPEHSDPTRITSRDIQGFAKDPHLKPKLSGILRNLKSGCRVVVSLIQRVLDLPPRNERREGVFLESDACQVSHQVRQSVPEKVIQGEYVAYVQRGWPSGAVNQSYVCMSAPRNPLTLYLPSFVDLRAWLPDRNSLKIASQEQARRAKRQALAMSGKGGRTFVQEVCTYRLSYELQT
jgi:hypothetical protein